MNKSEKLINLLRQLKNVGKIIDSPLNKDRLLKMNFTASNQALEKVNLKDTIAFNSFVFGQIEDAGTEIGYGGYDEKRIIYSRSDHFGEEEPRCLHLGIDLWMKAYTTIYAPLDATVHSFADNKGFGDYGPTIILTHHIEGETFYTLYGHLSESSLNGLKKGMVFRKGEKIGAIGNFPENGDWPPHLHFQLITDMLGKEGDFPGVVKLSEREKYLSLCLDPNLILKIE